MNRFAFLFRLRKPSLYSSECNRIHLNVELAPFLGMRFGKPDHPWFARRVVRLTWVAAGARSRADVYDLASPRLSALLLLTLCRLAQERRGRANDSKRRGQMHTEYRFPLLIGHLVNHRIPGVARIVHDDVDPAKLFDRRVDDS